MRLFRYFDGEGSHLVEVETHQKAVDYFKRNTGWDAIDDASGLVNELLLEL